MHGHMNVKLKDKKKKKKKKKEKKNTLLLISPFRIGSLFYKHLFLSIRTGPIPYVASCLYEVL
jgi:hypothetical protein